MENLHASPSPDIKANVREQYDRDPVGISIQPESWAAANRCFRNVAEKVQLDGGSGQYGWMFLHHPVGESPGFVAAIHHAVWRSPANELIDITPHVGEPIVMDGNNLLFVADDAATPIQAEGYKIGLSRPSHVFALTRNREVKEIVRQFRRMEWEYGRRIGLAT